MKKYSLLDSLSESYWKIWFLFFLYPLFVGFFIQLVVLPYLFPSLHAGEGLLKGGDWLYFHRLAKDLAERIRVEGWGAWELRPEGQAPAGIAAIFYVFFGAKPWVILPLNALVHALSGVVLFSLVYDLVGERKSAFLATLPFIFFPSAMTWYTQIHKDGIFILGVFLFLLGWNGLLVLGDYSRSWKALLLYTLWSVLGGMLVWIVRPYGLEILWFLGIIFALLVSGIKLFTGKIRKNRGKEVYRSLLFLWLSLAMLTPLAFRAVSEGEPIGEPIEIVWKDTPWLPDFLEGKFVGIARVREAYYRQYDPQLAGNIDWEVSFHSAGDVMRYIPRALEIGIFAPFPRHWFEEGTSPGGDMTRKIAALETIFVYLSLAFLVFGFLRSRKNLSFWAVMYFSLSVILVYALSVPNLGSLYRARYGFWMLLVALGWGYMGRNEIWVTK